MAFLIGGANSLTAAYDVENSLRFPGESAELTREQDAGNRKTWTCSFWLKDNASTSKKPFWGTPSEGDFFFMNNNKLNFQHEGSSGSNLSTVRLLRDPSAWYHLVIASDTTQGTAANRFKLYINGSQYTWDDATTYPAEDSEFKICQDGENFRINAGHANVTSGGSQIYMADFAFVDGTAYAASDFGETDEDSGIWKPKKPSVTWGTNGFFLEFKQTGTSADASGIGADTSGNGLHFTVTDLTSVDVTTDTPTNNFCTFNPLNAGGLTTFSEGNCKLTYGGTAGQGDQQKCGATMGVANGKWYWEMKSISGVSMLGVMSMAHTFRMRDDDGYDQSASNSQNSMYANDGAIHTGTTNSSSWGDSYTDDDIIGVALDMDNQYVYFSKNGTFQDSGDPTSGSSGTGASDYRPSAYNGDSSWGPFFQNAGSSTASVCEVNFGNPPSALSSGNADANGYGNFEYAPPSGYYALCTKNLAEYG